MPKVTRKELFYLATLFLVTIFLRLPNLGYSDYIGDEFKAFLRPDPGQTTKDFFLTQRKGPMQFLVSHIPYLVTNDFHNELAQRLPFTIFGILSIFVFYAFVKKITKNVEAAFLASFLLSVCGFVVGFARIAQYQNLNLFFSFLALFFYADFVHPNKNLLRSTLFGTIALSLSVLSHWDAVFVLPPIIYFFGVFLNNKQFSKRQKNKLVLANLVVGSIILLPFLLPYLKTFSYHSENQQYFVRRVEVGQSDPNDYEFLIKLYNPFVTFEFYVVGLILATVFIKKNYLFASWFLINISLFLIFIKKPDTHVYNFIIPLILFITTGIIFTWYKLPKILKHIWVGLIALLLAFFVYQSYLIFVDNKIEYPWRQETFFGKYKTRAYTIEDKAPLFGFPLNRFWKESNEFVVSENTRLGENYGYLSNEWKTITERYMDVKIKSSKGFYIVAIKRPLSFVNDWNYGHFSGKQLVKVFEKDGEEVVRIYRVEP